MVGSALLLVGVLVIALRPPAEPATSAPSRAGEPVSSEDLEGRRGALVDQVVFTREADVGRVTGLIEAGSHQLFTQGISSPTVFNRLRDSLATGYDIAYGTYSELTLNPAGPELADGTLNPFHVPAIREALNRLIDRRHVAEEIFGGLAVPRLLPLSTAFPDYSRLADVARELELRYAYDPVAAGQVIHDEMLALGARRSDGQWWYAGELVQIKVLIRTEDERRRVGDYLSNLLEDQGFAVERRYRTAEEASRLWIATDPMAGHWHVYTGSWISTVIMRDQAENFSFFYTPRGRAEPLWQAYQPTPEFDELADRLQRRDYRTLAEREAMMASALALAMQDSSRVWLVDQINATARAANVQVAVDLAGGLAGSALWPYTLRYTDRVGGEMVIGMPALLAEPWNPIAGSNWAFDRMITRATQDPAVMPDPFTGLYLPQRLIHAQVTVEAGVPVTRTLDWLSVDTAERIEVPAEAWLGWDQTERRFLSAGELHPDGLTTRTRVRVHYDEALFERHWHDGTRLSLADFVLPWIVDFERAAPDSALYDVAHLPTFEAFQRHFRGWRIVSEDPLIIDIYSDQIYPDAESMVAARAPNPIPWHTLSLGVLAEQRGQLAFSSNKADRLGADWMSLVAGPSLAVLESLLEEKRQTQAIPYAAVLGPWVDGQAANRRFEALARWHGERGHFWIGNGPFELEAVYPVEGSVVLKHFADFPDPADKWLRFASPMVPELELDGPLVVEVAPPTGQNGAAVEAMGGAEGLEGAEFRLTVTFEGQAYSAEAIDAIQVLLFNGRDQLTHRGEAESTGEGNWRIRLSPETLTALGVGANSLELAVTSKHVALPVFASHVFATVPQGGGEQPR
ncbi:ABC transporter substrate-binding protein [Halomonas urumqiensis]|nr:ABC transporter substrate-binding protein [Halomonas urumqiensis]